MKKLFTSTIIIFCIIANSNAQSISIEESKIQETLWKYLNGRNNGDTTLLKKAFHNTADLRYIKNDDEYRIWPINEYISKINPGKIHQCQSRIISIDIMGTAAQAIIEIEYSNWLYTDYINLLKDNGDWIIAVKTFSGRPINNNKRILFVLTSQEKLGATNRKTGLHLGEVTHVYKPLYEAGYSIDFVSPKGGATRSYGNDINDPINLWFLQKSSAYYKYSHALTPDQIDPLNYAAIYFVGGHGTMWDLPNNEELNTLTQKIYENDGVVAAVCHGPSGIVNVKLSNGDYLVKNKRLTAFTNQEEAQTGKDKIVPFLLETTLVERGAQFIGQDNWQENVLVDGRLITGQNPASAHQLALEMIKIIEQE